MVGSQESAQVRMWVERGLTRIRVFSNDFYGVSVVLVEVKEWFMMDKFEYNR